MPQFRGVVKHLIIINVLIFIAVNQVFIHIPGDSAVANFLRYSNINLAMNFPSGPFFKPYQVVTHMFMHGNWSHLAFNMFSLWMFGSALEMVLGSKRFLKYYFICGFGALALYVLVWYWDASQLGPAQYDYFIKHSRVLGASGAIFGVLAGYAVCFPENQIMLLIPPIPIKAKYFVPILALLELFLGVSNLNPGVAHFAHLGGALIGFLLLRNWKKMSWP